MAKEMMIVFVYDTELVTDEAADPADSVLYFHPGWVSDGQRHALCGQVVGVAHCVGSLLALPTTVSLRSGKFVLKYYGRYLLAIGSDRNIPDWVLRNRADLLCSMIRVYHGDLAAVAESFAGDKRFADKLYQMLETYLPVLQFGCHIFQRVPMLCLPKSATSTYMEAMQVLEYCRRQRGSLGGIVLYNNKIVASQLPPALTSNLVVVEPHRVKSPAESVPTKTPLPLGAQLLLVYVGRGTYDRLVRRAAVRVEDVDKYKKNQDTERDKSEIKMGMKRDKSLLFTAVPEEDQSLLSPPQQTSECNRDSTKTMPDVVPFTNRPRQRPNKLSLSFKTQQSLDEEGKENVVFTGQTSVCSTPMIEYKRLHGNVLSICQNPESQQTEAEVSVPPDIITRTTPEKKPIPIEKDAVLLELNNVGQRFVPKPTSIRKMGSLDDIQGAFKRLSSRATARFRKTAQSDSPSSPDSPQKAHKTLTINDPSFPVFRNDGVAISESLYQDYLDRYHSDLKDEPPVDTDNMFTFNTKLRVRENFENFDSTPQNSPKKAVTETVKPADQSRRKSLSLPLKSLSENSEAGVRRSSGVQLTPLMEKLSHLAFSDKSSGYGSRVTTPLEIRDFCTLSADRNTSAQTNKSQTEECSDSELEKDEEVSEYSQRSVRTALFISGLHNMALFVLLELDAANDPDVINALWETSLNALGPIEQQCMEPLPTNSESKDYSYLALDPDWGTVQKGGPWVPHDIATLGHIHKEFEIDPNLTELCLRSEDSVVVGTSCGGAEVFYAESGPKRPGIPPPSDLLATAPLKAKRRLLRDHSIVIL